MISFKRVTDLFEARKIWQILNSEKSLFDDWDFRLAFYKHEEPELFFWVAYENSKPACLLPLQWNKTNRNLEFFGGRFMFSNDIYTAPGYEKIANDILQHIDRPAELSAIELLPGQCIDSLCVSEYLYTIDLTQCSSFSEYLGKNLNSKYRSNLKRKIKLAEADSPQIRENEPDDLETLFDLNIKNFGNVSSFNKPFRQQIFHDLLNSKFNVQLLGFTIDSEVAAASFSIMHNGVYFFLNLGSDREKFSHLGTFVSYQNALRAMSLGAHTFNAGLDDLGWKESWGMIKTPQYTFTKT